MMERLSRLLRPYSTVIELQSQVAELAAEVEKLRAENNSMKTGMRRCVSCTYRIDYKQRQSNNQS